uniref:Pyrimidine 5-nucleotidase n=1 Tax=Encephalitozoon cuniculi TaxID=6035 RepID=M1JJ46_ENCCN|nr:hypothetical protein ECU05_1170 [Encephalitozoon cuniculi]
MGAIESAARAAFKVFVNGIKKVRRKAGKLVFSSKDERRPSINPNRKEREAGFSVESKVLNSEELLPGYEAPMSERPFKGPVFIEMGQDPASINTKPRKIGNDILFLYDIDDTLYHPSNNLQEMERKFLVEKFLSLKEGSTPEMFEDQLNVALLYSALFYKYGNLSLEEYWEMISEFDYLQYLSPDMDLRNFLLSMKNVRKCCFTNGPRDRAENILTKIGILDCFEVVVCIGKYDKTFCCKPLSESYEFVTKVLGIESPGNVYFFDDSENNIIKAREIGWNGWLITRDCNILDVSSRLFQAICNDASSPHFQEVPPDISSKMALS